MPIVYGRVTDAASGEGLLGVNLQLTEALRGTSSDADGHFRFALPHGGAWTLRVTRIGYRTVSHPFTIGDEDSLAIDLPLAADFLQVMKWWSRRRA